MSDGGCGWKATQWALAVCLFSLALVAGATEQAVPGLEVLDERAGAGEQCIVCRQPIEGDPVVEARYKGRTFYVAKSMLSTFEADPEAYFRTLQARGGLFDEAALIEMGQEGSNAWLLFGVYILVGLVFAATTSYLAIARGRAPVRLPCCCEAR